MSSVHAGIFNGSLQRELLLKENHFLKPEMAFIEFLAGAVKSVWPSQAAALALNVSEMKTLPRQDQILQMLKKWVSEGRCHIMVSSI